MQQWTVSATSQPAFSASLHCPPTYPFPSPVPAFLQTVLQIPWSPYGVPFSNCGPLLLHTSPPSPPLSTALAAISLLHLSLSRPPSTLFPPLPPLPPYPSAVHATVPETSVLSASSVAFAPPHSSSPPAPSSLQKQQLPGVKCESDDCWKPLSTLLPDPRGWLSQSIAAYLPPPYSAPAECDQAAVTVGKRFSAQKKVI